MKRFQSLRKSLSLDGVPSGRVLRPSRTREVTVEEITEQISFWKWLRILQSQRNRFFWSSPVCFVYILLCLYFLLTRMICSCSVRNVANWCGVLGVLLSTKLYGLFGYGAWVSLPIGAFVLGWLLGDQCYPRLKCWA